MRASHCTIYVTCLLFAGRLSAQEAPLTFGQVLFGPALRSAADPVASDRGFQAVARLGLRVRHGLGAVAEASLATFPDQLVAAACPAGVPCLAAQRYAGGLGALGVAVGLQPRLQAGSIEFRLTATAGGSWLYHHAPATPGLAPLVRGALAIGLPISSRVHVLLEGSATRLLRAGVRDADTRHLGIGLAIN